MSEKTMRIRELREAAGLTQAQLADSMGVAQSNVVGWETENYLPRAKQLPLLAGVLGCEYNDLFSQQPYRYDTA